MKCVVAEHSGFCHGVTYTISTIDSLLRDKKEDVYSIGLPVHNPQVTQKLVDLGLHVVNGVDEIEKGTLVIRAHGLPPQIVHEAESHGLTIVNTTCGFVVKAQNIARSLYEEGYRVIIVGEAEHPEVQSIFGVTENTAMICGSVDQIERIADDTKVGVISQTTFPESLYKEIIDQLQRKNFPAFKAHDTICNSIARRCNKAKEVASAVDVMLVVGGKMSSNTRRLYEVCKKANSGSYHIEIKDELLAEWFSGVESVGITAGASTPQWVVDDIRMAVETGAWKNR